MQTEDHYQFVYNYFVKRVNDAQTAKDLTQDVFLKIIQNRHQFENIKNLSGWIATVARNRLIDHYRAAKIIVEVSEASFSADEDRGDLYHSLEKCLDVFLQELGEEDQRIIRAIDLNGKSQKELAKAYGLPEPTLRSKVQRARKKLHRRFVDMCFFSYDSLGNPQDCLVKKSCDC